MTPHKTFAPLRVEGLSKTYPGHRNRPPQPALYPISFQSEPGEMVVVLGPNGAGKTTLFKILSTLIRPDSGQAWVAGHALSDSLAVRREIGWVSDPDRSFFWRLNAGENLDFFATAYGLNAAVRRQRITDLLEQMDLAEHARKPVGQLSSGQRGRLALARALLHRPAVLLLDEPTRSLDPAASVRFLMQLRQHLAQTPGASVLLSTHRLDAVAPHCERLLILAQGRLQADGAPAALLAQAGLQAPAGTAEALSALYVHFTAAEPEVGGAG